MGLYPEGEGEGRAHRVAADFVALKLLFEDSDAVLWYATLLQDLTRDEVILALVVAEHQGFHCVSVDVGSPTLVASYGEFTDSGFRQSVNETTLAS